MGEPMFSAPLTHDEACMLRDAMAGFREYLATGDCDADVHEEARALHARFEAAVGMGMTPHATVNESAFPWTRTYPVGHLMCLECNGLGHAPDDIPF